jgi:hypothetical protein
VELSAGKELQLVYRFTQAIADEVYAVILKSPTP